MKNKGSKNTTKKIASLSLHENERNNNHPVEFRDQNEQGIIVKQMNNNPDKTTETGEDNKSSDSIEGNEESSDPDGGREDGDPAENNEIGRASCRERGKITGGGGGLNEEER